MKKDYKNIEDLFSNSLNGYKIEPSKEVWKKINFKLNFKDFFSPNFGTFNVYYLTAITGLIISLLFILPSEKKMGENKLITEEILSEGKNQNHPIADSSEAKTTLKKKKVAISYPTEVYTQNDFKIAKIKQDSEVLPLPLKNNLKEFSNIYGDSINQIESLAVLPPNPKFTLESKTGCAPFQINLKNQTELAQYYEWSFGDGNKSSKVNPTYIYQYPGVYAIKLKAIGNGGIAYCMIDSVRVYDGPKNKITLPNQTEIEAGEPITIQNETHNAVKFEWDFGDGTVSTQKRPEHIYQSAGQYAIVLKSWTDKNCMDSAKIATVNVFKTDSRIIFPNAFCPNPEGPTDGKYSSKSIHNDIFHPLVRGQIAEYHLKIYNREGALIFESNDVQIGWDGYYHNQRMAQDVYPYIVSGKFEGGKTFLKKGNVTIIYRQNN